VKKFVAEGGYRLYPDKVMVPVKASSGDIVTVCHRWNNLGWGYCPNNIPQWNYRYKAAIALLDKEGTPVKVFVEEKADPSLWYKDQPGTYMTEADLEGVRPGRYRWAVGIVDTSRDNRIGIDIAVSRELLTKEGWAVVSDIKIN
jgi:hypothetical protein